MKPTILVAVGGLLLAGATAAQAQLEGFTANPTTNSADFEARVTELGGSVDKSINFESHPLGTLQPDFYSGIGVTLTANGDVNTVVNGAGPGQTNTSDGPLSSGEGTHPASNYLQDGNEVSSLTISFDTPTAGAGLFTIDYFNPSAYDNPLRIEAFDGPNGTGNSLGYFDSEHYNFQMNNMYFMGVIDPGARIRSVVFYDLSTNTGDSMGLDDIWFVSGVTPTPEKAVPSLGRYAQIGLVLLLLALASLALRRRA